MFSLFWPKCQWVHEIRNIFSVREYLYSYLKDGCGKIYAISWNLIIFPLKVIFSLKYIIVLQVGPFSLAWMENEKQTISYFGLTYIIIADAFLSNMCDCKNIPALVKSIVYQPIICNVHVYLYMHLYNVHVQSNLSYWPSLFSNTEKVVHSMWITCI